MKNIVSMILGLLVTGVSLNVNAQTLDTVTGPGGRLPGYHYSYWYDTCNAFFDTSRSPSLFPTWPVNSLGHVRQGYQGRALTLDYLRICKSEYTPHPIAITGFGVWIGDPADPRFQPSECVVPNASRGTEYVYVVRYDSINDSVHFIDSARWDTAAPKVLKLPRHVDTSVYGFHYCHLYEVHLSKPIVMDSLFYLTGSFHNNILQGWSYHNIPTVYAGEFVGNYPPEVDCKALLWTIYSPSSSHSWATAPLVWKPNVYRGTSMYGFYMPMVDYVTVVTQSLDSSMGIAYPGGQLSKHVGQTLHADPAPGYTFSHWVDGSVSPQVVSSDNPRSALLTQDTTFTAVFRPLRPCHVEAKSHNNSRGVVNGGGDYTEGDTVVLIAVPREGYMLRYWSNGCTDTRVRFVVDRDTSFTAIFSRTEVLRVDGQTSNHQRGYVTGSGYYYEYDTVTLRAVPQNNFVFLSWNDSSTANPRRFVVTHDTIFTAYFTNWDGIHTVQEAETLFTLTPNPAHSGVTVTVSEQVADIDDCRIFLVDAAGHELLTLPMGSAAVTIPLGNIPSGTYFVILRTPEGSFPQRLVVN